MFIIYDLIFLIFILFYLPVAFIKGKAPQAVLKRFGFIPPSTRTILSQKKNIWIHAVSVGEVMAVLDFIRKLRKVYPSYQIVLSTVTKTGYQLAQQKKDKDVIVIFAPLDFSFAVRKFADMISPVIYLAAETEIWPNLYTLLNFRKVPIVQINGRISDKAFVGYKRLGYLTRKVVSCVDLFCMQSDLDAERVIALGADRSKVQVVGNLKFDQAFAAEETAETSKLLSAHRMWWVAGSTHPGEEEIVIRAFLDVKKAYPDLGLIIAPRHIERAEEVASLLRQYGCSPIKYSRIPRNEILIHSIVVVDEIGHLLSLYAIAAVVFIGKTFCVGGGQNMIEPVALGNATIVGPRTENFKDAVSIFLKEKVLIQINEPEELSASVIALLNDPSKRQDIEQRSMRVIARHRGATDKTVTALKAYLRASENKG
jgi:3-deoxy-D-manno-octulosonic-acid transferase